MEETISERIRIIKKIIDRGDSKNLDYLENEFECLFELLINKTDVINTKLHEINLFLIGLQMNKVNFGVQKLNEELDNFLPILEEINSKIDDKSVDWKEINNKIEAFPISNSDEMRQVILAGDKNIEEIEALIEVLANLKRNFVKDLNRRTAYMWILRIIFYLVGSGGLIAYYLSSSVEKKLHLAGFIGSFVGAVLYTFGVEKSLEKFRVWLVKDLYFNPKYAAKFYESYCRILIFERFAQSGLITNQTFFERIKNKTSNE